MAFADYALFTCTNFNKEMQDFFKISISTKVNASQPRCQKGAHGYFSKTLVKADV